MNILHQQLAATLGDEEVWARAAARMFVSSSRIASEHVPGGRMQWNKTRLSEFRIANGEDALLQINVLSLQCKRFAYAQAGHCESAKETVVGPPPQSVRGR
jgi:hypothetical protein